MSSVPKFFDRVQETSTTTGTGTYTLAGAVTGFQSFAAVGSWHRYIHGERYDAEPGHDPGVFEQQQRGELGCWHQARIPDGAGLRWPGIA
jgi:hypothetical protein